MSGKSAVVVKDRKEDWYKAELIIDRKVDPDEGEQQTLPTHDESKLN